jgi:nitrite reductase/ring-hydroxylating ferredoxin subunit
MEGAMEAKTRRRKPAEVLAGAETDFPEGKFVILQLNGAEVGVIRLAGGEWRAVRNACPHKGAPICRGIVGGTWPPVAPGALDYDREGEVLVCPWHGFEYDLKTGAEMFRRAPTKLRLHPVELRGGQVFVTV